MADNNHEIFSHLQLTPTGSNYFIRNYKLVKWLFLFSLIVSILVVIDYFFLISIYRTSEIVISPRHNILSFIVARLIPFFGIVQALLYTYGSYIYYKFSSQVKKSIEDFNEEKFNDSIKYIFRVTLLSIVQCILAIFIYSSTILFIFKRITHDL
jgi:hypothetical protein